MGCVGACVFVFVVCIACVVCVVCVVCVFVYVGLVCQNTGPRVEGCLMGGLVAGAHGRWRDSRGSERHSAAGTAALWGSVPAGMPCPPHTCPPGSHWP